MAENGRNPVEAELLAARAAGFDDKGKRAILTCMDARLDPATDTGPSEGDAKLIHTRERVVVHEAPEATAAGRAA